MLAYPQIVSGNNIIFGTHGRYARPLPEIRAREFLRATPERFEVNI
jgi:hypothetical protein